MRQFHLIGMKLPSTTVAYELQSSTVAQADRPVVHSSARPGQRRQKNSRGGFLNLYMARLLENPCLHHNLGSTSRVRVLMYEMSILLNY